MNKYIDSKKIKNNVKRYFLAYIGISAAACLLSLWIVDAKTRLNDRETFGIFYATNSINAKKSIEFLNSLNLEGVKENRSFVADYTNIYFIDNFQANGVANSDLFIMPEDAIQKYGPTLFGMAEIINDPGLEIKDDVAIKVYDKATNKGKIKDFLLKDATLDQDYYVFVNKDSKHIMGNAPEINKILNKVVENLIYEEKN